MQTVRQEAAVIDISKNGFQSSFVGNRDTESLMKRLKISELKSWAVSFAVISLLTGLLMYLKVAVTMETVTNSLFFLSLGGFVYAVCKIIFLLRQRPEYKVHPVHSLN